MLGSYAFPSSRSQKLPKEPDTAKEKQILKSLDHHLGMAGNIPEDVSNDIIEILKSDLYSKVFKRREPGTKIYRGMRVAKSWLISAIKDNFDEKLVKDEFKAALTFKPNSDKYSTSWSTDIRIADGYSRSGTDAFVSKNNAYNVILTCEVPSDMYALDCSKLYYALPMFDTLSGEKEVICFGNVPCIKVSWCRDHEYLSKSCQKNSND